LGDPGVDGRIIVKRIMRMWIGFILLRIGTNGVIL
jgi:hypothetical protein